VLYEGEPKAIPYSHLEPIRLAAEVWAHMDVKVGEVLVWLTSLGWMVGTMMIFGTFLHGATLCLFNGSHFQRGLGEFVQA
jgi:acyl-coenzyme A synthetase/AMP-(fatty) acid ligase